MMDKSNVLEKLKTLKQWQLEQQLDFKNINTRYGLNSYNEQELTITNDENKENEYSAVLENQMKEDVTQGMFMDRITPNILAQALKQVNLNCGDESLLEHESNTENDILADQTSNYVNNSHLENQYKLIESNIDNNIDSGYPGLNQLPSLLSDQQTNNLANWHMSGMQTVIFQDNKFHQASMENEITPIKFTSNTFHELSIYECSESEDGFSECDPQDDMDGCRPLSETEDDDEEYDELENENQKDGLVSNEMSDSEGVGAAAFFIEDHQNTVIEVNTSQKEIINEERPITPGIKGNRSFHELVENEIQKGDEGYQQKTAIVSSTPIKAKPRKFLKRGEGLKRFELGNYSKCRKVQKGRKDETSMPAKSSDSKPSGFTRNTKGSKENKRVNKGTLDTRGILKKSNSKKHVIVQNNERYVGKSTLDIIDEGSSESHGQSVNEKEVENSVVKVEESKKVTFENVIKRDIMDSLSVSASSDVSFQKILLHYKEKEERENKELDAFEALEEAAENTSLSSNCSLVIKHFGQRPQSIMFEQQVKNEMPLISENVASYDFDDEASWSDTSILSTDENDGTVIEEPSREPSPDEPLSPPKRIISKRKDESKIDCSSSISFVNQGASKSVIVEKECIESNQEKPSLDSMLSSTNISDTVKKKLSELEKEIAKFRSENNKLSELRAERENDVKTLRKEIETFQKEKAEELERIEEYRNEEMKKIKVERKLFDKYQREIKAAPSKEEREEIRAMRSELSTLKEESKSKEMKWNAASHRFRTRIIELEEENGELREEVRLLEKQRLERWKSSETSKKEAFIKNKTNAESSNNVGVKQTDSPSPSKNYPDSPVVTKVSLDRQYGLGKENDFIKNDNKESEDQFHLPRNIGENSSAPDKREIKHADGKVEVILPDCSRIITFPNGTKKTISKDEKTVTVAFFNGDVKKITPDNKLVYYYAESQTTHTNFPDGLEMLEFPNKQVEKRYPDGKTEVIFPDKTVKYILVNGTEETIFTDGTVQKVDVKGVRTISFANGQKEIHTKEYKRREYPNGTVKTVYGDGRQETKYSNGRVRVKDSDGNLLVDSGP